MSVFGEGTDGLTPKGAGIADSHNASGEHAQPGRIAAPTSTSNDNHYHAQYQHRGSMSTSTSTSTSTSASASDSTDSSPTTTISTADSTVTTDTTPVSSPESPTAIAPLSSFNLMSPASQASTDSMMSPPLSPFSGYHQPFSPGKKARNSKNLSLNMSAPSRPTARPVLQVKTASAADPSQPLSAPPSPSFILPLKPPRKRSSNLGLTIQTPATQGPPEPASKGLRIIPAAPSLTLPNTLRHHQSSPSLSLFSPTTGVPGGMKMPPTIAPGAMRPRIIPSHSRHSSNDPGSAISSHDSPIISTQLDELEEEDDYEVPLSQEASSPAYPTGPICIYDPSVYLYLEPTDSEASDFDVIFNVAREVKNPFGSRPAREATPADTLPNEAPPTIDAEDGATAVGDASAMDTTSPTTPKANLPGAAQPEYIHVPWDHNTNIVDDLLHLVEVIDERVRQDKRVLIHCQCGVSRSASLVVAYGLYKNPSLSVQEAYDAVKNRSKWIGPNMSLIYQLSEFRTKLQQRWSNAQPSLRPPRSSRATLGLLGAPRANTVPTMSPTKRPAAFGETIESPRSEPLTASLPEDRDRTPVCLSPLSPFSPLLGPDGLGPLSPGPSSAPADATFEHHTPAPREGKAPLLVPERTSPKMLRGSKSIAALQLRREGTLPSLRLAHQCVAADLPPSPALLSPRAFEFTANPFHMDFIASPTSSFASSTSQASSMSFTDPRSPVHRGEVPIVRNIFDVL
ncbi:MAG: hypothetical protein M1838_001108 [Thelocarpon superellum]|nr:MAG: hypothetical protein M1838_001108 [Thelocarpon superellum]